MINHLNQIAPPAPVLERHRLLLAQQQLRLASETQAIPAIQAQTEENTQPATTPRCRTPRLPRRRPAAIALRSAYNRHLSSFISSRRGMSPRNGQRMPDHIKKRLQEEILLLEHELAHELPAEIKKAASLGDLSENAEYHMAKQRQTFVNARLGQLKKRMAELSLVNLANIPHDKVGFGSTIVVYDMTKDVEVVYRLVTSEESDVAKGLISTTSPIGRGLVGKQVGDIATIVTPNGKRELEILKLTTIHDAAEEKVDEPDANAATK